MRRTARVLSATALAGIALGAAASAASADPAAEVTPGSVEPGGTVTISVTCDAIGGAPPDFIDAISQGFEEGKVQLRRVEGTDEGGAAAAAYSGTARIPPGENPDSGGAPVGPDSGGAPVGPDSGGSDAGPDGGSDAGPDGGAAVGPENEWGVDGVCPVAPGGREKQWNAKYTVSRGTATARGTVERPAPVQRGVRAGEGGSFTDSLPALIAGGALITGALGAAVYRLRNKDASADS
ncbi:hypothetical protein OHT59_09270 [Streptomyces sp. NBC_00243]|uniref:hypothetical protein n=1 Tax=Streptomyces sp. NBC_00243 TaxID=2975688 RepID=UPI002DDAF2BD|nr:hypothetical protein [Streptomyces sp. NBC_00243]WRZ18666.1 hypothetical protein OHT59_09270 [Streptomyces sp. NBC_00243]